MSIPSSSMVYGTRLLLQRGIALLWVIVIGGLSNASNSVGELNASSPKVEGFRRMDSAETGLRFTNTLPASRHLTNQLFLDGSGVTTGDVDGDGLCDIFFGGLDGRSSLWRNLGGWRFEDRTATAGLDLGALDVTGCVLADLSGNGALDLVVNTHGQGTHLFSNDGQGGFKRWHVLNQGKGGHSIAIADVDGDGWLDIYVCNYRVNALMDMPNARAQVKVVKGRTVVASIDGRPTTSGDLTNRFRVTREGGIEEMGEADVLYLNRSGKGFEEVSWTSGAFVDESGRPLKEVPYEWGLAAMFRDLTRNGRPDLYVANDFQSPDRMWLNESTPGRVRFRSAPIDWLRHTSYFSMAVDFGDLNRDGIDDFMVIDMMSPSHGIRMTQVDDHREVWSEVIDALGRPQYPVNTLFAGRAAGGYHEVAAYAGVQATDWSWSVTFMDVDLDGWEDILIGNGQHRAARDADVAEKIGILRKRRRMTDAELFGLRADYPRYASANVAFRNDRNLRFSDVSAAWEFGVEGVTHGMALADFDGDGDLDVVLNMFDSEAVLLENRCGANRLPVRLKGLGGNTQGIGARIVVRGGPVEQSQEMISGGRYLSGDDALRVFAAGAAESLEVEVAWPSGVRSKVQSVRPGQLLIVEEPVASARGREPAPQNDTPNGVRSNVWFELLEFDGATSPVQIRDDLMEHPWLPRRIARWGGGLGWVRFPDEGKRLHLVVPGEAGGRARFFTQTLSEEWKLEREHATVARQSAVAMHSSGVYVGLVGGEMMGHWLSGLRSGDASKLRSEVPDLSAVGALAIADFDGDGRLDMFVGELPSTAEYPMPAKGTLWRWTDAGWERDVEGCAKLLGLGVVRSAVWTDLTGENGPDLVVACDWGPIRLFRNLGGRIEEWNPVVMGPPSGDCGLMDWSAFEGQSADYEPDAIDGTSSANRYVRLSDLSGWWNSVTPADVDGDGRMDLVLGNWGANHQSRLYTPPIVAFSGPILSSGDPATLMGYGRSQTPFGTVSPVGDLLPMWSMSRLSPVFPSLRDRFSTHQEFAEANLEDVFGIGADQLRRVEARWFYSGILLNRGNRFEWRSLPEVAQWSPAFGIGVGDWNGDGHVDLFVAQNFFGELPGVPRQDAGLGLILQGIGDGSFLPLEPEESGIRILEEQRGVAAADFDGDGRVDVAVRLGDGRVRLFKNKVGRPGIQVRLIGNAENPWGIGARIRALNSKEGKHGVWQEITSGTGYGSMDDVSRVVTAPGSVDAVEVLWPGGKSQILTLSPGDRAVEIRHHNLSN